MMLWAVPDHIRAQGTTHGLMRAVACGRGAQGNSAMYTLSSLTQHWESLKYVTLILPLLALFIVMISLVLY